MKKGKRIGWLQVLTLLCLLSIFQFKLLAQGPKVPSKMTFANVKLKFTEDAKRLIQKDVDALTRSPKHFGILVDRANTYFPIIEKVMRDENIPEDFKYLALQESALIGNAVSSSNAVGYWQFKDFTALECGMRVDKTIDERMHIISATKGACNYLKKSNFYFNNWLYALQSYQMGAGATMDAVDSKLYGTTSVTINKRTYWYVRKYLAHKIAFQDAVGKSEAGTALSVYTKGNGKSLKQVAEDLNMEEATLRTYNYWIRKNKIPNEGDFAVMVPVTSLNRLSASQGLINPLQNKSAHNGGKATPGNFPEAVDLKPIQPGNVFVKVNGIPGLVAKEGEKSVELAERAGIDLSKLLTYNDIEIDDPVVEGNVYYLKAKRGKAKVFYHTAQHGETMWSVAQKYGVKLKSLYLKNRMATSDVLSPGRVLWLKKKRPAKTEIEYKEVQEKVLVKEEKKITPAKPEQKEPASETIIIAPVNKIEESKNQDASVAKEEKENIIQEIDAEPVVVETSTPNNTEPKGKPLEEDVENIEEVVYMEKIHIVEKKESLYSISKIYEVEVVDILNWNELKISDGLQIGQELIIKIPKKLNSVKNKPVKLKNSKNTYILHKVEKGETLYSIARIYGVTLKELMDWNDKNEFNLSVGEELKILKE